MITTVGQLIARLREFDSDAPIVALWDTIPNFPVHRVESHEGVVVIDVGDASDGDWWNVASDSKPRAAHGYLTTR